MTAASKLAIEPRAAVAHFAPSFGVYIHIPYCISRCPYCDFNTYVGIEDTAPEYVDALLREARSWPARETGSIFLGGGTPSLLDPPLMRELLDGIRSHFEVTPGAEITMEANPETVDVARLTAFHDAGINRISFGAQSFSPDILKRLGRAHTAGRTREVVAEARASGFHNLNLDLIYGTPGESLDDWRHSLEETIALGPEHISAYSLTIEQGTAFGFAVASGEMAAPDEDDQATKYEMALDLLADAGYEHYEVSNWARSGKASRHNLVYWTQNQYAGIGAGAHGYLDGVRSWNEKLPRTYVERAPDAIAGSERLDAHASAEEWLALRARLIHGISITEAEARLARDLGPAATKAQELGLADVDGDRLFPTRRGLLLLTELLIVLGA